MKFTARVAIDRNRFCNSSCTRGRKRRESSRVKPSRSTGRPSRAKGASSQLIAHTNCSGEVLSSSRLALCTRVNSSVAPLRPSSAERRVTTRGPARSSTQGVPERSGGGLPGGPGWSRNSAGGRCRAAGAAVPAGSRAARAPTNRARASSSGTLRRHSRQLSPLAAVISSNKPTRLRRQSGPARIGVTRKIRLQASFRRGSSRRNQLPPVAASAGSGAANWPMGIWRKKST